MSTITDRRSIPIFIHSEIDDMTAVTPNAMRVYMHLARRADGKGQAWPSYQSIGDHCFASVSDNPATRKTFARRAVDELLEHQLIVKAERRREDGGQTSNAYSLIDPPVLNRHPPVLNKACPVPIGTKGTPTEDTPKDIASKDQKAPRSLSTDQETALAALSDKDGRWLLQLVKDRQFVYLDKDARRIASQYEEQYTDQQLQQAVDTLAERHEEIISQGKRGITAPLAYLGTILRGNGKNGKSVPVSKQDTTQYNWLGEIARQTQLEAEQKAKGKNYADIELDF